MKFSENYSLKQLNTFSIDVKARKFGVFTNAEMLQETLSEIGQSPLILGGGSNILFTKEVEGYVLKNEIPGIEQIEEDDVSVLLKAGAGVNWHSFVQYCLQHDFAGAENLALIPGNVGASPMQNIGAYGVEVKDIFYSLQAIDTGNGEMVTFDNAACEFGYRDSIFKRRMKNRYIITNVTFRLLKKPVFHTSYGAIEEELKKMNIAISIQSIAQAVINIRRSKLPDPAITGNAGSFFKNPEINADLYNGIKEAYPSLVAYPARSGFKVAAAWMIEQCGWKGFREGDAGCHPKQPLVLVNYGNATGLQILELSNRIMEDVHQKFGITLEKEVNIL